RTHLALRRARQDMEAHTAVLEAEIEARRAAEQALRYLALHDPLTGLGNRAALNEQLAERLAIRPAAQPALLLIDLFQFKDINDAFGECVGDALLRAFAYRLAGAARG
ncbi:diguanylate cyclase domain-containing protein, partial [Escherichia coli]|uniref:diguanylate cyclase domain-containing protein n=1 Tax=Escherichia coli TaxID=562 RepID=UPI003CE8864F